MAPRFCFQLLLLLMMRCATVRAYIVLDVHRTHFASEHQTPLCRSSKSKSQTPLRRFARQSLSARGNTSDESNGTPSTCA